MDSLLVYGDSLSWGIVPGTRKRLEFEERWPGVMEIALRTSGEDVRVIEDCLNGRRTVWEDPYKPGRNGLLGLGQKMEIYSPLRLAIVLLGTNDFQFNHPFNNAWTVGQGIAAVVNEMRKAPIEPGMTAPPVLIVSPPVLKEVAGFPKFAGAAARCVGLAGVLEQVAREMGCAFFDAASVAQVSDVDGVHLEASQHKLLGEAMAREVAKLLAA
jgi:lysophospholipase L1-like esterase